ncbi:MAG: trypsin-like peptidase domain-containing protein [Coriobacteriia bacterium]|nr:trypsin-like peptidase domain-containing protein [Coriobacteriia bacterium]MBN2841062.1 trypsin-like peptidase domain-containing protein [Coriobacteriia bacterium]
MHEEPTSPPETPVAPSAPESTQPVAPVPPVASAPPVAATSPVAPVASDVPRRVGAAGVIAIAVVLSLFAGAAAGLVGGYAAYRFAPESPVSAGTIELVGDKTEEVVAAAAAVALPSVVNIDVSAGRSSGEDLSPGHPDVPIQGEGSGVAYLEAPDGGTYIITNNHVVDGATEIMVTDSTGERHRAELIGGDGDSDIAVVRVDADIPTIETGDIDTLVVGQLAIAIGSPFGLEHSVTSGVISALHRPLTDFGGGDGEYPYVDSIQTDAAINPGNSGGALVDREGRLIGIPSAIYSNTGVSDGVGLAIPVDRATQAADELIEKGRVDTPFLGVIGQTVTPALVTEKDLPVDEGAYIVEVSPGSEAEKAGVLPGDVIVAVDDGRVRTMDDLVLAVRRRAVGDEVTLRIWRDGERIELEMVVGVKPDSVARQ